MYFSLFFFSVQFLTTVGLHQENETHMQHVQRKRQHIHGAPLFKGNTYVQRKHICNISMEHPYLQDSMAHTRYSMLQPLGEEKARISICQILKAKSANSRLYPAIAAKLRVIQPAKPYNQSLFIVSLVLNFIIFRQRCNEGMEPTT